MKYTYFFSHRELELRAAPGEDKKWRSAYCDAEHLYTIIYAQHYYSHQLTSKLMFCEQSRTYSYANWRNIAVN